MASFWALVSNPHVFVQFPHVIAGAMATAAFFMLGISAWQLRRASAEAEGDAFRRSFRFAAVYALASTVAVIVVGHNQAQYMVRIQPMKMAAAEALWETADPAAMSLFTWGDEPERRDVFAVKVPGLLSFLAYNRFDGQVKGINELQELYEARYGPGDYVPPVKWTYWTFRAMAGAGFAMLALAAWAVVQVLRERFEASPRLLWLLVPALGLPYLGNSAGWLFTEIGRQPWIVFGLQKTADAVSPNVTAGEVLFSLVAFTLLYGALMAADVYLLLKYAKAGVQGVALHDEPEAPLAPAEA
jgi:cytochrome d ubiquinol oxidase subunit I